jgi:capsular polysaccharide biosynthesis protein
VELRELLTTLRARWKFVVALILSGVVGAFVITWTITPVYESTVRVYFSASGNAVPDQIQLGVYTSQRVNSYAALAEDDSVLEGAVNRAGVDITPEALAERAEVEVVSDSVVLLLSVRDSNPEVARTLTDAYAAQVVDMVTEIEAPRAGDDESSPVQATIQSTASVSSGPVSPDRTLGLAVGALLGLLFGVGGALLRELSASKDDEAPAPTRPHAPPPLPSSAAAGDVTDRLTGVGRAPSR